MQPIYAGIGQLESFRFYFCAIGTLLGPLLIVTFLALMFRRRPAPRK